MHIHVDLTYSCIKRLGQNYLQLQTFNTLLQNKLLIASIYIQHCQNLHYLAERKLPWSSIKRKKIKNKFWSIISKKEFTQIIINAGENRVRESRESKTESGENSPNLICDRRRHWESKIEWERVARESKENSHLIGAIEKQTCDRRGKNDVNEIEI